MKVNGREFTFVRPTIYFVKKIAREEMEKIGEKFSAGILDDKELEKFSIQWRKFCSTIFEKDLLWKLGLFPKQLKLENVPIGEVLAIIKSFFDVLGETLQGLNIQSKPSKDSETKIKSTLKGSPQVTS